MYLFAMAPTADQTGTFASGGVWVLGVCRIGAVAGNGK